MDRAELEARLQATFDGNREACTLVSRQARDLADSGRLDDDVGSPLTVETLVSHLADAPEGYTLVERWNWWIGSIELSHGNYHEFRIRPDVVD